MMMTKHSHRLYGSGRLRLCLALTLLILFSVAAAPAYAQGTDFFDDLSTFTPGQRWQKADWVNGSEMNVCWRKDHVKFGLSPDKMILQLDNEPCPVINPKPYASGELQSLDPYGYGKFETRMKAANGSGLVTSFFIYTGSYHGATDHDEIDIEILGKESVAGQGYPSKIQFHYYTDGISGPEVTIDVGVDLSAAYHRYGFVWSADKIEFYFDGVLLHTMAKENLNPLTGVLVPIPTEPGKIMANLWTATPGTGEEAWLGVFTYPGTPIRAGYDWILYDSTP
ncbi:MAG TPA: family 16 glycosylhydrolase [Pyrinomonadaceae bacterium]|nr:family 16 glycosylhydrolase [Pyrinomonadaceae bacterium]